MSGLLIPSSSPVARRGSGQVEGPKALTFAAIPVTFSLPLVSQRPRSPVPAATVAANEASLRGWWSDVVDLDHRIAVILAVELEFVRHTLELCCRVTRLCGVGTPLPLLASGTRRLFEWTACARALIELRRKVGYVELTASALVARIDELCSAENALRMVALTSVLGERRARLAAAVEAIDTVVHALLEPLSGSPPALPPRVVSQPRSMSSIAQSTRELDSPGSLQPSLIPAGRSTAPDPLAAFPPSLFPYARALSEYALVGLGHVDIDTTHLLSWRANGVPEHARADVWMACTLKRIRSFEAVDAGTRAAVYAAHVSEVWSDGGVEGEDTVCIRLDVPRTQPNVPFFAHGAVQTLLERLVSVWAAVTQWGFATYAQGMVDICCPFLVVFYHARLARAIGRPPECRTRDDGTAMDARVSELFWGERFFSAHASVDQVDRLVTEMRIDDEALAAAEVDTFWAFSALLDQVKDNYGAERVGLAPILRRVSSMLESFEPELAPLLPHHVLEIAIFRWINCLFLREVGVAFTARLWDALLLAEDLTLYLCAMTVALLGRAARGGLLRPGMELHDLLSSLQNTTRELGESDEVLVPDWLLHATMLYELETERESAAMLAGATLAGVMPGSAGSPVRVAPDPLLETDDDESPPVVAGGDD